MSNDQTVAQTDAIYALYADAGLYIALCTDGAYTESTKYGARVQIDSFMAAGTTAGVGSNTGQITFTFTGADTITHWALCNHLTNPIASSYVVRDAFAAPTTFATADVGRFLIGSFYVSIQPL